MPTSLPPSPILPSIFDGRLQQILEQALPALGRLDSITTLLPDTGLFLHSYVRKEAVLSAQTEGIQGVRKDGDREAWLEFFLEGVRQTADGAVSTARRLVDLFQKDRERIQKQGRAAGSALRVHETLKERPLTSLQEIRRRAGLSFPAASTAMSLLVDQGIARGITGKKRNRAFGYS